MDETEGLVEAFGRGVSDFLPFEGFLAKLMGPEMGSAVASISEKVPENISPLKPARVDRMREIAFTEGIAFAWVPRADLVQLLLEAPSAEARRVLLEEKAPVALEDCDVLLRPLRDGWALECRESIGAYRAGFWRAAQSHAANIIDTVGLAVLTPPNPGSKPDREARAEGVHRGAVAIEGETKLFDGIARLTLAPLAIVWEHYDRLSSDAVSNFSRHATAHSLGRLGVLSRVNSLIAVMVATSLTMQFWDYVGPERSSSWPVWTGSVQDGENKIAPST